MNPRAPFFLKTHPTDFWVIFSGQCQLYPLKTPKKTHVVITYVTVISTGNQLLHFLWLFDSPKTARSEGHRLPSERYVEKHSCGLVFFLVKFRATFLRTWIVLLGRSPQVCTKLRKFLGSFAVKRHSPKDGHFGGDDSSLFLESPLNHQRSIYPFCNISHHRKITRNEWMYHLEPQTKKWWFPTISYVKVWFIIQLMANHL